MAEPATNARPATSFDIVVNKQRVPISEHSMTGLQIKQAAIDAGIEIQLNFQLAELKNGKRKIIGDNDHVGLSKSSEFVATSGDDNS